METEIQLFTQNEVGEILRRNKATLDTWLLRGILQRTKVGGRSLRTRLFSVEAIFEAKLIDELAIRLAIPASEAKQVARCATADWDMKDGWKPRVARAIERSARIASVYLLIKRRGEGWITKTCYGDKDGPFKVIRNNEKWLDEAFAVLPVSLMFETVVKKCEEIQSRSDDTKTRKRV